MVSNRYRRLYASFTKSVYEVNGRSKWLWIGRIRMLSLVFPGLTVGDFRPEKPRN